ncbi:Nuclear transcription factor Y subunit nfyc-1 [Caenorhabditis elegans]|nr:Nuclear transcription factor Y subunit nfyc-1 [Caenorhabditis elegans]CTQ86476.1 Nuclear transcription factor Y subunit nfyc-1 [Caenorhabditis elegans]|eukprot:NP_001300537.1 Nuclear transcription factor Y subunit gamma [Caenorhabditis elegans]
MEHPYTPNMHPINMPSIVEGAVHPYNNLIHHNDAIPPAKYASMRQMTEDFWREKKQKMTEISEEDMLNKSKNMSVPMARVKKIMRIDDDVRNFMIASDAPIFMAQAAEFFIEEMTAMGWQYVSEARRRILQKADIASAVQKSDQFDFLIDFLPPKTVPTTSTNGPGHMSEDSFQDPNMHSDFHQRTSNSSVNRSHHN